MRKNTWTESELQILNDNFPSKGLEYCLKQINYSENKIRAMAFKLNLKINRNAKKHYLGKPNNKCNVNPDLFYNITKKEVVYFLGLLWADGFLNKTLRSYNFGIKMCKDDLLILKNAIEKTGKWHFYELKGEKETWKDIMTAVTNNKRIYDFLVENDYNKKSFLSPDKILNKIPTHLQYYFFRGIIDGDGCFYYKKQKNTSMKQLTIASTIHQDWSYIENLYKSLGVKYSIYRRGTEKSSYSVIRVTNKDGIEKIGNYIYSNYPNDNIGLSRKYEKFQLISN